MVVGDLWSRPAQGVAWWGSRHSGDSILGLVLTVEAQEGERVDGCLPRWPAVGPLAWWSRPADKIR